MKMNKQIKTILPLAVIAGLAVTANAAVIQPVSVDNVNGGNLSNRDIGKTIDGSGLIGDGDILTQTHSIAVSGQYWISSQGVADGDPAVELTFDLGVDASYDIDSVHLWNYSASNGVTRWLKTVDVSFSSDNVTFGNTIDDLTFADVTRNTEVGVDTVAFSAVSNVRYIKFSNITNGGDTNYLAFSEIRFGSVVPEPSTTALLGLGGLALILRRRK